MADIIKKVVESPAKALEETIEEAAVIEKRIAREKPIRKLEAYWHMLGPGWTTGAADDDPSGIATYSQAGAQYGNQLLWLASFTFPLMAVVQEMCARIGLVTGRGLAANIRAHYPRWVLYLCTALLAIANTLNIGADLGAMAKATQLVVPAAGFTLVILSFALLSLMLQIFISYQRYARYLKYLALILLSYVLTAFAIENFDWRQALTHAVAPSLTFSREQIILVAGILGTTISPYLFFWQTSQEVEEEILHGKTTVAARRHEIHDHEIKTMRIDIWSGMFLSNVVMFFIIAVGAATLFASGTTTIATAADAAAALRPLAGENAYLLFALGIIGTGLLAIPVLAGSVSYALSESLGWQYGLYRKLKQAYAFYGVMILAILIGLAINFLGIDPIKALIWSAVGNGLIAPVILVLIMQLSNNKKVMGNWTNGPITNALGWLITLLMVLSGAAALIVLVSSVSSALF